MKVPSSEQITLDLYEEDYILYVRATDKVTGTNYVEEARVYDSFNNCPYLYINELYEELKTNTFSDCVFGNSNVDEWMEDATLSMSGTVEENISVVEDLLADYLHAVLYSSYLMQYVKDMGNDLFDEKIGTMFYARPSEFSMYLPSKEISVIGLEQTLKDAIYEDFRSSFERIMIYEPSFVEECVLLSDENYCLSNSDITYFASALRDMQNFMISKDENTFEYCNEYIQTTLEEIFDEISKKQVQFNVEKIGKTLLPLRINVVPCTTVEEAKKVMYENYLQNESSNPSYKISSTDNSVNLVFEQKDLEDIKQGHRDLFDVWEEKDMEEEIDELAI